MNNKIGKFILCNLIGIIIEYLIIFLCFRFIFKASIFASSITCLILFIIMSIMTIVSYHTINKIDQDENNYPHKDLLDKVIKDINYNLNTNFNISYAELYKPNPAWCIGESIYVNTKFNISEIFLPGIIAHEVGHALSKISNYTYFASIKPSTLVSGIIQVTVISLIQSKNIILNKLSYLFYYLLLIVNLNNIIFVFPFLRDDELVANDYAVKLGYGHEIRSYYSLLYKEESNNLILKMDYLTHPSIKVMIDKINQTMLLSYEFKDLYFIKNKLVKSYQDTLTITLPSNIYEIGPSSFYNVNLKKVSGENVLKVSYNAFNLNPNIEVLNLPNVCDISINEIKRLKKLKNVIINNDEINFKIVTACYHSNYELANKLLKKLVKKGYLDAIEFFKQVKK